MKKISISIMSVVFGLLLVTCNARKSASSRQNLEMPQLVEFNKFKSGLPIEDLKNSRPEDKSRQLFNYFFTVDTGGNVIEGKIDQSKDVNFDILTRYIRDTFDHYKWHPAFYNLKQPERLKSVLKMSIYDDPEKDLINVSIRLVYLPGKEKLDDIFEEKNLVYEFQIKL